MTDTPSAADACQTTLADDLASDDINHAARVRELVDAMVGHDTSFQDAGGTVEKLTYDPIRRFDVLATVTLDAEQDLTNTKALGQFEFEPTFYEQDPVVPSVLVGDTDDRGIEYGIMVVFGALDSTADPTE